MKKSLIKYTSFLVFSSFFLTACSGDLRETKQKLNEIKATTTEDIEPIPKIRIYEKYTYQSGLLRSPFVPDEEPEEESRDADGVGGLKPDPNRNKEFLEGFPLDTLSMVGTITSKNTEYALVLTNDGLIHQVKVGNYMGLNDGEILNISESAVELREIVPNGLGGYIYRPSEIQLKEES